MRIDVNSSVVSGIRKDWPGRLAKLTKNCVCVCVCVCVFVSLRARGYQPKFAK